MPAGPIQSGSITQATLPAQRGIALVLVLWIAVALTVLAAQFVYSVRTEALAARNLVSVATARAIADGAVNRAMWEALRGLGPDAAYERGHGAMQYTGTSDWAPDGRPHVWEENGARVTVTITDESTRINLNAPSDVLLRNLLRTAGGLNADDVDRVADAIADWRDADDFRRPHGAEASDYRAAGLRYAPANGPFETVEELRRVLGVSAGLYARIADSLTVHSNRAGVSAAYATRPVLLALPGATPQQVDAYLTLRDAALVARLPLPPFPQAGNFDESLSWVWRIRAQASVADNVLFVREAIIETDANGQRLPVVYAWREGDQPATQVQ